MVVGGSPGRVRGGRLRGKSAAAVGWVAGAVVGWLGEQVVGLSPLGGPRSTRVLLRGERGVVVRVGGVAVEGAGGLVVPRLGLGGHRILETRRPIVVGLPCSMVSF